MTNNFTQRKKSIIAQFALLKIEIDQGGHDYSIHCKEIRTYPSVYEISVNGFNGIIECPLGIKKTNQSYIKQ